LQNDSHANTFGVNPKKWKFQLNIFKILYEIQKLVQNVNKLLEKKQTRERERMYEESRSRKRD
jgi:hypothetical protein